MKYEKLLYIAKLNWINVADFGSGLGGRGFKSRCSDQQKTIECLSFDRFLFYDVAVSSFIEPNPNPFRQKPKKS
jgi:hypothetical protein